MIVVYKEMIVVYKEVIVVLIAHVWAGHGYYVPLAVYLRDDHPESPPVCIIQPTPEMMIKPNHHHVDVQGLVRS